MKNLFLNLWRERIIETIIFFVAFVFWLFLEVAFTIADYSYNNPTNIYFVPLVVMFGWFFLKLDKTENGTKILVFLFSVTAFFLIQRFIQEIITYYRYSHYFPLTYFLGNVFEIVTSILIILILLKKPKYGFIFLLISVSICAVFVFIELTISYASPNVFTIIIYLCFYAESCLVVSKHVKSINNSLMKPSKVESELLILNKKRELGIITEEEYVEKRKNIVDNLSRV